MVFFFFLDMIVIVIEKLKVWFVSFVFFYLFIIFQYQSIKLLMTNSRGMNSQHRYAVDRYRIIHRILYIVPEDIMVG